jgi:hypothetical protein
MEFRADYRSNIAEAAKADAAAVRELADSLEAASGGLKLLQKASGSGGATASGEKKEAAPKYSGGDPSGYDKMIERWATLRKKERDEAAKRRRQRFADAAADARAGLNKAAVVGGVVAAAGVAGGMSLGRLAMGYQGMARLQALGMRTQLQMRQLFRGVDPSPVVRAADRFLTSIFSPATASGKALAGIMSRSFNGAFQAIERIQPYVTGFFKGAVIGALMLENAWLDLRIATFPAIDAFERAHASIDGVRVAGYAGAASIGALALAAGAAVAPFAAAAGAIGAVMLQIEKLSNMWDDNSFGQITKQLKIDLGFDSAEAAEKRIAEGANVTSLASQSRFAFEAGKAGAPPPNALGEEAGRAYAQGIAAGAAGGADAAAAAGGSLAGAVDKGFRTKAEIHSPSKMAERSAEYIPEGTIKGMRNRASDVQAEADRSLVPQMPGGASGAGSAGARSLTLNLSVQVSGGGAGFDEGAMRTVARHVFGDELRAALASIGFSPVMVTS